MKKKIIIFLISISIIFINSCEKKKTNNNVFLNKNKESVKNLNFKLIKEFEINGEDSTRKQSGEFTFPTYIGLDNEQNIFIVDKPTSSIKKFDKNGNFILSFGRKGPGPGEFRNIGTFVVYKDTLYISEWSNNNISRFTNDGKFIDRMNLEQGSPRQLNYFDNTLIGYNFSFTKENDKSYMVNNINFFNKSFEPIKTLKKIKILQNSKNKPTVFDIYTSYCVGKDEIYIAKNSIDKYLVEIYSKKGDKKGYIAKNYMKTKLTSKEKDAYQTFSKLNRSEIDKDRYLFKKL